MKLRRSCTRSFAIWVIALILPIALAACTGGGSAGDAGGSAGDPGSSANGGSPPVTKILSWAPPTAYQDNSALDPMRDLAGYNIYIKSSSAPFTDSDIESAFASSKQTSIDLIPVCRLHGLQPGIYHVSVRAIATNGLKSDFSPAAAFKL